MDFNVKEKDTALRLFVDAEKSLQKQDYTMYIAQHAQAMSIAEKVFKREDKIRNLR